MVFKREREEGGGGRKRGREGGNKGEGTGKKEENKQGKGRKGKERKGKGRRKKGNPSLSNMFPNSFQKATIIFQKQVCFRPDQKKRKSTET